MTNKQYETVIGLEVHVELATNSKIFCSCSTKFGEEPNTQICPVCTGMPGSLPVLNKQVVEYAIAVGLATNCTITKNCKFDRKNYFYPDKPQNYQISQFFSPICRDGNIEVETKVGKKTIRIHEIHMEEDAGKLNHKEEKKTSLIDYNRSGVPLIEIVSSPDMSSSEEVIAYLEKLRLILQYLGVSDCKLQEGSMRVDVNLSIREKDTLDYGTRTEIKNLNSFRSIANAIEIERLRQIELLQDGKKVRLETRRWDDKTECSYTMRLKEDLHDYRYFPDPDLGSILISEEWINEIRLKQPEFRDEKRKRYKKEYGIPMYDIDIITSSKKLSDLFEETIVLCNKPKKVSNWLMVETMCLLKEKNMDVEELCFSPENLAKLIFLLEAGTINNTVAKEVFELIFNENIDPEKYVKRKDLTILDDEGTLRIKIKKIIKENPKSVKDYQSGKQKAIGYLVGQTMKEMRGRVNPEMVQKILKEFL